MALIVCACAVNVEAGEQQITSLPPGKAVSMGGGAKPAKALPATPTPPPSKAATPSDPPATATAQASTAPKSKDAGTPPQKAPASPSSGDAEQTGTAVRKELPPPPPVSPPSAVPALTGDAVSGGKGRGFGTEAAVASDTESSSSRGGAVFVVVAVLCLLVAGAGVVAVVLRRRRLQRQGYADFGSLEMRGYAQWQQDAGL